MASAGGGATTAARTPIPYFLEVNTTKFRSVWNQEFTTKFRSGFFFTTKFCYLAGFHYEFWLRNYFFLNLFSFLLFFIYVSFYSKSAIPVQGLWYLGVRAVGPTGRRGVGRRAGRLACRVWSQHFTWHFKQPTFGTSISCNPDWYYLVAKSTINTSVTLKYVILLCICQYLECLLCFFENISKNSQNPHC